MLGSRLQRLLDSDDTKQRWEKQAVLGLEFVSGFEHTGGMVTISKHSLLSGSWAACMLLTNPKP